jgi:hypothetical protein
LPPSSGCWGGGGRPTGPSTISRAERGPSPHPLPVRTGRGSERAERGAIKKRASRPPPSISQALPEARAERGSTRAKQKEAALLLLRLLGLFRLRLLRLLRFLSHSILSRVNGETRHEGCSAEGQPRNILGDKLSRFAGACPALSHLCHCVIHSSDAFSGDFYPRIRIAARRDTTAHGRRRHA